MATHAPMARVPFAPLDNPRLQQLASAKNRQNGIVALASSDPLGKSPLLSSSKTSVKRSFESTTIFEDNNDDFDNDGENVDPASLTSPCKKSRSSSGNDSESKKPVRSFAFSFSPSTKPTVAQPMAPPPTIPSRLSSITPIRANMSSPRTPLTAPAGRSPKRKSTLLGGGGILKPRRTSAPFSRIDPPAFTMDTRPSGLPFSLDAALSGTLSQSVAPALKSLGVAPTSSTTSSSTSPVSSAGKTIAESMPKHWFFEIYEDTAEEEAANLMEHSTLTLDLSSDDEDAVKARDDRGKENCPPEGYDAPTASRPHSASAAGAAGAEVDAAVSGDAASASTKSETTVKSTGLVRKRKLHVDAMDDGMRAPLSELETESLVVVGRDGDVKGENIVWEDDGTTTLAAAVGVVDGGRE